MCSGSYALLDAANAALPPSSKTEAISYRVDKGFDHFKVALSIGVQRMVRSDLGTSGVIFTIEYRNWFSRCRSLINAAYGLGENVVQGTVTPDEYCVFKPTLKMGFKPILPEANRDEGITN
jgi:pyruvate,water dikinase